MDFEGLNFPASSLSSHQPRPNMALTIISEVTLKRVICLLLTESSRLWLSSANAVMASQNLALQTTSVSAYFCIWAFYM